MPKKCNSKDCNFPVFSKGYCKFHSKRKPINPMSKKRANAAKIYSNLRKEYLSLHPVCEVCKKARSTDIHHVVAGSLRNSHFTDTESWMAICRQCHTYIHENPRQARNKNLLK